MGWSKGESQLCGDYWVGVTSMSDRDGHHATIACAHWCHRGHRHSAQPDPQTIHLNAAQAQPRQKKLLASSAPYPPSPPEAADSRAAPPAPPEGASSPLPQQQGRLLAEARSVLPSETAPSPSPPSWLSRSSLTYGTTTLCTSPHG